MGICQWSGDFFVLILISKGTCIFETLKESKLSVVACKSRSLLRD